MKRIYSILIFCMFCFTQLWSQDLWQQANEAYSKENYSKAITLYEQLQKEKGNSTDLYYNLGNAYYKNKQYPKAILNYERALLLSPGNTDVKFNLDMAKARITDKIEPVGTFFLVMWINTVRDTLSSNSWAILGIICFILFIIGAYLYFFTRQIWLKKMGFFVGLILLVVSIIANCFASAQKEKIEIRNEAIVFAPSITIKSAPAESGTDLFVLHEGTKVKVLSKVGEWSEILIEDGNRGWLPSSDIEII